LNVEPVPAVAPADWVLEVGGMVDNPLRLDHAAWRALPRANETKDFHCVEGWSVSGVRWGGVALGTVLAKAGVKAGAKAVVFHAHGGTYSDDLALKEARDPSVLLADTLDEAPLPADHGGPLRLVVPTQLGYKNVKWVQRIEVTDHRMRGYWEQRGYPAEAPVR
jgi:DMSO/TMAO reductase YedYZ molybdopterin-dependent catalytic subunit